MTSRCAEIERNTSETRIRLKLAVDGRGQSKVATKIPFFDHILFSAKEKTKAIIN